MAAPNGVYFPALDECLKGDQSLLSWKLVASDLQDARSTRLLSECVARFLQEPFVHGLINAPSTAFGKPTPQSKSAFETKTAAINVTPTSNDKYDIKTIKEDALWLSKNADINEVDALRIVIIEFQARPKSHLSSALSTQDVINLQQAVGADGTQANALLALVNATETGDAETIWTDFNTETSRRRRLAEFYLSERRSFMLFLDSFLDSILGGRDGQESVQALGDKTYRELQQVIFGNQSPRYVRNVAREELLATYLKALPECLARADKGSDALLISVDLELEWLRTVVVETFHLMAAVFQLVDLFEYFCPATIVSSWFKFVDSYGFMDRLQGLDEQTTEVLQPLKNLACVISMKMLNLPKSICFLDGELPDINLATANPQEDSYLASDQVLVQIHEAVINAANMGLVTAGPVIFTWTLILQRMLRSHHERQEKRDLQQNRQAQEGFEREVQHVEARPGVGRRSSAGSIVSMETQSYDIFLNSEFGSSQQQQDLQNIEQIAIAVTAGGQMHSFFTDMALSLGRGHSAAFRPSLGSRMRLVLLDFLTYSFPVVGYISESVTAFLAVLAAGHGYWDISSRHHFGRQEEVVAAALNDDMVIQTYIGQALLRYPHEFAPFTSLCKMVSMSLVGQSRPLNALLEARSLFLETPTLTFPLPDAFWEFTGDEADIGRLELVRDVHLFSVAPARKRLITEEEPFCIPAGTQGQLASDAGRIVQLQYTHSTIALLGKRLEANLAPDSYDLVLGSLQVDDVAEVVSLLATLICCDNTEALSGNSQELDNGGLAILREASRALPRTKDIISVVCDTLDSHVDGDLTNLDASSLRVMTACLEFLDSVLPTCPGRVWSYMTRCDLLISSSKAGRLSRITGTLELIDERFDLLSTVVRFFSNLVNSSVKGAVHRKVGSKASGRSTESEQAWLGTSDKALSQVTLSIAHTAVDIFENTLTWRFSSEIHRSMLLGDLIPTLESIVVHYLSIGNDNNVNLLTAFLEPAARYTVDGFLCSDPNSLRFQPLLSSMLVTLGAPDSTLYQRRTEIICQRQIAVLDFATTLIRVANIQEKPATAIEVQLLKCSSLLARLCAVNTIYRKSTLALLGALAERISRENSEAPSLLGYLGPQISRSFLQAISKLDKPFDRPTESKNAWAFFSTIMRNGQHWMANCLLTGKTPREALSGDGKLSKLSADSILKTALTRLRSICTLPTAETLAILDLLTSAHNYWQWTVFASQEDDNCLSELRAYVRELKPAHVTAKSSASRACDEARIAAYIAEAFAMHLYHLRKTGREKEFAEELVNDLDYYLRGGVTVDGYNSSLHANFAKNFARQYPGFALESFQRTLLVPRNLGKDYYYALDLADKMLSFDAGWAGPREKNGFKSEMETANLNLSLVDAQIALFHAWEFLLLELSTCLVSNKDLIRIQMMQVAEQCLECNQGNQGPERIFLRIMQSRANLAMALIQRLTMKALAPKDVAGLLSTVWATINSIENPFGPDQIQYWRTMLRMLYVTLRGYRASPNGQSKAAGDDRIIEVTQCVFNIIQRVVAQGFRSLVSLIHDSEVAVLPEDVALITAILQACLCLPGMDQFSSEILNIMISEDVGQVATSLFSWSDKLAVKGDPVYGELSVLFLLQLSNVPAIAEHLASDGLLAQLASANITAHIQRPNVSPFADNVGAQRCYGIWAKGILPLLLNVLSTPGLGANIASEVAYVLNRFPNLLKSSVERIEAPGMSRTASRGNSYYVTLLSVSEINSLALLTRGLSELRTNFNHEIPDVPWDSSMVLENVDYWLSTRRMLRERLLPLGQREADWRNMRTEIDGVNVLEAKVVSLLEAVKEVLSEDQE